MGIRELLSEILGDEGHAITLAENAQQAREARAAGAPDLVLLDIWMPDTDGVTLLKEWQRDGLLTMPVIMMSGHATIDTAVEATRIGALNFLEKPIALQKLLKAVQQGLSRAQEVARAPMAPPRPIAPSTPAVASEPAASAPMFAPPPGAGLGAGVGMNAGVGGMGGMAGGGNGTRLVHAISHGEGTGYTLSFDLPLREARDAFERMYFEHHLGREGGSMTRVAEKTGLERTHLYRKLKQLGVEPGKLAKKGG
jgi:DNA-binding NtrC family response regulator